MERLRALLVKFLPGYCIQTLKIIRPLKVNIIMRQCFAACEANPKLVYLVNIACPDAQMACLSNGAQDNYYTAIIQHIGITLDPNIPSDALRRNLEQMLDSLKSSKFVCDICQNDARACDTCSCNYNICSTCLITLIYNAIRETRQDIVRCPKCRVSMHRIIAEECQRVSYRGLLSKFLAHVAMKYAREFISEDFANDMRAKILALA